MAFSLLKNRLTKIISHEKNLHLIFIMFSLMF
jgi:hypothetical protein